ncbi:MAG: GNAT family N-acetyltransferase [Syntrophales bacterium]
MKIRRANQSDVPEITLLAHELGYRCKESDIRERLSRISRKRDHVVLACADDHRKVIGWIHGFIRAILQDRISLEIEGFVVTRKHRRNGVGSLLLEKMEEWAASHGISKISLGTNIKRKSAHRFYYKRGFRKTKVHYRMVKYL